MASAFKAARANPFSKAGSGSKIPDGKATYSNAIRVQSADERTLVLTAATEVMLFAGINGMISLISGTPGGGQASPIKNHVDFTLQAGLVKADAASAPTRWRGVSYGMVMSLVNNAEQNAGWWEAVRLEPNWRDEAQAISNLVTIDGKIYNGIGPQGILLPTTRIYNDTWTNHPTYQTGRLRDLHAQLFN